METIKCTCKENANKRVIGYGMRRICNLHKWRMIPMIAPKETSIDNSKDRELWEQWETEELTDKQAIRDNQIAQQWEARQREKANENKPSLADIKKMMAERLKPIKGLKKVRGSNARDYRKLTAPTVHISITLKQLALQLSRLYGMTEQVYIPLRAWQQ